MLLSHSSRDYKSEIKILAEVAPSDSCESLCSRPLPQCLVVCWQSLVLFDL